MVTHLKLDSLECEVKWALGSIIMNKASGGGGIPAELFQILKDDALKCCTHYASKFGKLSRGHKTGKDQFYSNSKERQCQRMFTLLHNYTHFTCYKVILKILQARLQSTQNENFQMYKLDLEKAEEPEIKLPTSAGS